jgi:hypothetical protein
MKEQGKMWIASKLGFYSIVKKAGPAGVAYHVRARTVEDLERLKDAAKLENTILFWDMADYKFRMLVSKPELKSIMAALANGVTYPNFKAEIASTAHQRPKLPAYHELWMSLAALFDPLSDELEEQEYDWIGEGDDNV